MHSVEELQQLIGEEISTLQYPDDPKNLYDSISYMLSLGGKRMRPVLVLMGCDLFSGEISNAIQPAIGIEIFHNFTLVHDDIMDNAPKRRGKETVHERWNQNVGILSGDAMLVNAYEKMTKSPSVCLLRVLTTFNQTALEVCEGQQFDMDFEEKNAVSISEYLKMIRLKTAVLVGGSLKIGGIIAGATEDDQENIYQFGVNIGIAFQLQDDILDVYADQDKFGKQKGGDIISKKKTFLLIKALEKSGNKKEELLTILNSDDPERVEKVIAIYDQLDIRSEARKEMENHYHKAMEFMTDINVEDNRKEPLMTLVKNLMSREF